MDMLYELQINNLLSCLDFIEQDFISVINAKTFPYWKLTYYSRVGESNNVCIYIKCVVHWQIGVISLIIWEFTIE